MKLSQRFLIDIIFEKQFNKFLKTHSFSFKVLKSNLSYPIF